MKQAGQYADKAVQQPSQTPQRTPGGHPASSDAPPRLEARLVSQVFQRMQVIYGQRWSGRFGDRRTIELAKQEWADDLGSCSADDIQRGLDRMKREYPDWPPTLPQFRELCRPRIAPSHRPFQPALPESREEFERRRAVGREALDSLYREFPWLRRKEERR